MSRIEVYGYTVGSRSPLTWKRDLAPWCSRYYCINPKEKGLLLGC